MRAARFGALILLLGLTAQLAGAAEERHRGHFRALENYRNMAAEFPLCQPLVDELARHLAKLQEAAPDSAAYRALQPQTWPLRRALDDCYRRNRRAGHGYEYAAVSVSAVAAGGEWLVTVNRDAEVFVWNTASGRAQLFAHDHFGPSAASISADGNHLLLSSHSSAAVYDLYSGKLLQQLQLRHPQLRGNQLVGSSLSTNAVEVYRFDRQHSRYLQQAVWPTERVYNLNVSTTGNLAWTGTTLINLHNGATVPLQRQASRPLPGVFAADDQTFYLAGARRTVERFALPSGSALAPLSLPDSRANLSRITLSPDGRWLALMLQRREVRLLDTGSGAQAAALTSTKRFTDFAFAGGMLMLADESGATLLLSPHTGGTTGRLLSFSSGNWAVINQDGFYDAAHAGEVPELSWRAHQRSLQLSQLKEQYWQPGLLGELLAGTSNLNTPAASGSPPTVRVSQPEDGMARISVADSGGGIGRVRVLLNDKEIPAAGLNSAGEHTLEVPAQRLLPGTDNSLEVIAWDGSGAIAGRGANVVWRDARPTPAQPKLHAVIIGVSDYAGDAVDLRFAAADARRFADAVKAGAARMFGSGHVSIDVLTESGAQKSAISAAFRKLKTLSANDVLVVYLAGHGVNRGNEYYYLTAAADSLQTFRASQALSSSELIEWINASPVSKQVMVLDTCAAGALQPSLLQARGLPAAQIRAIQRLRDRTGFHVLMGSAADRYSYEANQYGQGLLTYALLEGMRGAALRDGQFVDVSRLFQHALDRVPELARHLGGVQQPIIAAPRGDSFDIGILAAADRQRIKISQPRPLLNHPVFVEAESGFDRLALGAAVYNQLAQTQPRGGEAALLVTAGQTPGAISISGSYTTSGEQLRLNVKLLRDSNVLDALELSLASAAEPKLMAQNIVEALYPLLLKLE